MVSAEQRWNEGQRAYGRAVKAYFNASRARDIANTRARSVPSNTQAKANLARAESNLNRARNIYNKVANQTSNAYRNLLRKYHLPSLPARFQNAVMENIVRNKKAQVRHNARVRELSKILPPNMVKEVIRFV